MCVREERLLIWSRFVNMSVTTTRMTPIITILSRWSDLTPTSHVWTRSQDRVPSVWCCPAPYWLSNEGPQKEGVVLGRVPPAPELGTTSTLPQLLIHSPLARHNKQRPHRDLDGRSARWDCRKSQWPGRSIAPPLPRKQEPARSDPNVRTFCLPSLASPAL